MDLHDLRMQEFPHNVRLALNKLDYCLQSGQPVLLQRQIIDEFIFCPQDRSSAGNRSKVLCVSIRELMVVRILCDHLTSMPNPSLRGALMVALFHPSSASDPQHHPVPGAPLAYSRGNHPPRFHSHAGNNPYGRGANNPYGVFGQSGSGLMNPPAFSNSAGQYHRTGTEDKVAHRLAFLSGLISLAVATSNRHVLEAVAVWMQQVCCLSGWSGQVCKRLIAEYSSYRGYLTSPSDGGVDLLRGRETTNQPMNDLPSVSPLFTANLITSWAQLYARLGSSNGGPCRRPPVQLLRLVVSWLQTDPPGLLLTPLLTTPATATPTVTAIAPLLRWCVEAPFFVFSASPPQPLAADHLTDRSPCRTPIKSSQNQPMETSPISTNVTTVPFCSPIKVFSPNVSCKQESSSESCQERDLDDAFGKRLPKVTDACSEERDLYSALQLCLLKTLQAAPTALINNKQVLSSKHVITIVEGLTKLLEPSVPPAPHSSPGWRRPEVGGGKPDVTLQEKMEAVNRLAQVILVATKTNCLYGSHAELWGVLRRLPIYNRLVKILLTSHQTS